MEQTSTPPAPSGEQLSALALMVATSWQRKAQLPCSCQVIAPGTRGEYRCLDRSCPRHGDAAEAAR